MEDKRQEFIRKTNQEIYDLIHELLVDGWVDPIAEEEIERADTSSDAWYELAAKSGDDEDRARLYAVAGLVLSRNAYEDGLPFCPLCGKICNPRNNGRPVIEANVCDNCNMTIVIPKRLELAKEK